MASDPIAAGTAPAVHFITLGCPKNEVDSDRMKAAVAGSPMRLTDSLDEADVVVVNTCGFIRDAVEEGIAEVLELSDWRDAREGRRLVVAGCMVSRYGDELAGSLNEADAFVPVVDEARIVPVLAELFGLGQVSTCAGSPSRTSPGPSAYLQISDGCHRTCAYCTIPSIRGPYRSLPLPAIIEEAALLAAGGASEIVLIGQDTSSWGRDLEGPETVSEVLRAVAGTPGVEWVRLMYVQPDGVTDRLLETMASTRGVCHYLDIPLQHASTRILRAMDRSGSAERFLDMIDRIRAAMPEAVLRTSVIAGFPGESTSDVRELEGFLEQAAFDYIGVFPFSPEDGTPAAALPGLPPKRTRLRRAQRLRDLSDRIGEQRAASRIGSDLVVISEGVDEDGAPVGRWSGQAPDVDGIVLLDREIPAGEFVTAHVTDSLGYDLEAEVAG